MAEKFCRPKISKTIDREPVVVSNTNWINPTSRHRENYTERDEMQTEVTGWGKNETIHTCPSANRLHSARPENALHLKRTLAGLLINDGAYPEKHWTASLGNAVGVMKPSLSYLYHRMKSFRKSRQVLRKAKIWQILGISTWEKFARIRNLNQNPPLYMLLEKFQIWSDMHQFEASWTCWTFDNAEIHLETEPFSETFPTKTCGKTLPKTECNQRERFLIYFQNSGSSFDFTKTGRWKTFASVQLTLCQRS